MSSGLSVQEGFAFSSWRRIWNSSLLLPEAEMNILGHRGHTHTIATSAEYISDGSHGVVEFCGHIRRHLG